MTTLDETLSAITRRLPPGWRPSLVRVTRLIPVWAASSLIDGVPTFIETSDVDRLVRMAEAAGGAGPMNG
jgi:hypothetical protein